MIELGRHSLPASLAEASPQPRIVDQPVGIACSAGAITDRHQKTSLIVDHQFAIAGRIGRHDGHSGGQCLDHAYRRHPARLLPAKGD